MKGNNSARRRDLKTFEKAVAMSATPRDRARRELVRNTAFRTAVLAKGKPSWPPVEKEEEAA